MAIYAVSDIHGYMNRFFDVLKVANFDWDNDELYVLGDVIDRGPHSAEMLYWCVETASNLDNIHFLLGNHEDMAQIPLSIVQDDHDVSAYFANSAWEWNGGRRTLDDCREFYGSEWCHKAANWIQELPMYYIVGDKLLVHAGLCDGGLRMSDDFYMDGRDGYVKIPGIEEEQYAQHLLWVRERWFISQTNYPYDVIFGHSPTSLDWMISVKSVLQEDRFWGDGKRQPIVCQGEPGYIVRQVGYDNQKVRYCIDTGRRRMGLLRLDDYAEFYSEAEELTEEEKEYLE